MPIFSSADRAYLAGPHVSRMWLAELDLPSGIKRVHNGVGRIELEGHEWRGVTDPGGMHLVQLEAVEDPRFGQATSVTITLGGITSAAWKEIKHTAREIEGRRCDLLWGSFNPEYPELQVGLKKLFPGKISSPSLHREGIGVRYATFTIESTWQSQNYPFGGRWSSTGQKKRYPGDMGGQFIGVKVHEIFQ